MNKNKKHETKCYRFRGFMSNKWQKTSRIGNWSQPQTYLIVCPQVMLEIAERSPLNYSKVSDHNIFRDSLSTFLSIFPSSPTFDVPPHFHIEVSLHLSAFHTLTKSLGLKCLHSIIKACKVNSQIWITSTFISYTHDTLFEGIYGCNRV